MMRGALVTKKGMEDIASHELETFTKGKKDVFPTVVLFDLSDMKDLARIAYFSRTASRVLYFIGDAGIDSLSSIPLDGLSTFLKEPRSFAVMCERQGEQDTSSKEIEEELGGLISERLGLKADLDDPDLLVFAQVYDDRCYVGIDFAGFDVNQVFEEALENQSIKFKKLS